MPGASISRVCFPRGACTVFDESDTSRAAAAGNADRSGSDPEEAPRPGNAERIHEDLRLLERYHKHGDEAAREEVIRRFLPLAHQLARRYERPEEPLEDLMQVASMGLVKAVERFDPERGTAFSTFAVPTILGELKRYFRDVGWALHVPRGMQERALEVNGAVTELSRELGRSPTTAEVARFTEMTTEEVLEAMDAALAHDSVSLEAPPQPGEEADGKGLVEQLGEEDEGYELAEYSATLAPELRALPERDRQVLRLRFVEDLTQSEIAERMGVSQMHVSRLIRGALARLRSSVEE
jgi:RNA polymerase sigma-B factor